MSLNVGKIIIKEPMPLGNIVHCYPVDLDKARLASSWFAQKSLVIELEFPEHLRGKITRVKPFKVLKAVVDHFVKKSKLKTFEQNFANYIAAKAFDIPTLYVIDLKEFLKPETVKSILSAALLLNDNKLIVDCLNYLLYACTLPQIESLLQCNADRSEKIDLILDFMKRCKKRDELQFYVRNDEIGFYISKQSASSNIFQAINIAHVCIGILGEFEKISPSVRSLSISYKSYEKMTLETTPFLKELDLSTCSIEPEDLPKLRDVLVNSTLEIIKLNEIPLRDSGAEFICQVLNQVKTLRELSLRYNDLGDSSFQLIAEQLNHIGLRSLDLSYNIPTEEGTQALFNVLEKNSVLEELILEGSDISEKQGRNLAEKIVQNPMNLHRLNLRCNSFSLYDVGIQLENAVCTHNEKFNKELNIIV